jgi:hypothetical protein
MIFLPKTRYFFIFGLYFFSTTIFAQNTACKIDEKTLLFVGKPIAQARCLLRPNKPSGVLSDELKKLPDFFENNVGKNVDKKLKNKLRKYTSTNKLDELFLGGSLDESLSIAILPNGEKIQALYFLIHDTSTPNYLKENFPNNINENSWKFNNLASWLKNPVAHIFVNRLGESITTTPFNEAVKKGWGTKFARDFLKNDAKGLQIHIELVQPRRSNLNLFVGNDQIAPEIGFTDLQYERLALLYICASVRRGTWLVPAYHSAIDAGIKDAHDDPQNFELEKFSEKLKLLRKRL